MNTLNPERLRYILAETGLPDTPLSAVHQTYRKGRGRKLHRRHTWRKDQTNCGLDLAGLVSVEVSALDGVDSCNRCGDDYLLPARQWAQLAEVLHQVNTQLAEAGGEGASASLDLHRVSTVFASRVDRFNYRSLSASFPAEFDVWQARREHVESTITARLLELRTRLTGRPARDLQRRIVAQFTVEPIDGDQTFAIPKPWGGEVPQAGLAWAAALDEGGTGRDRSEAVCQALSRPAEWRELTGLITEAVLSGADFATPDDWARAELRAGARRWGAQLAQRWEARFAQLLDESTQPLRYVAFQDLWAAEIGSYAGGGAMGETALAVALLAGAPLQVGSNPRTGITVLDPVSLSWLASQATSYRRHILFDLGPADTDSRFRQLVMEDFAGRWAPGPGRAMANPHDVLAVSKAMVSD
jgi:hypothetical protein